MDRVHHDFVGYGLGRLRADPLWMPRLVKPYGLTDWQTGLVNTIPFAIAAAGMVLWGLGLDKTGELVWHNAQPLAWMVLALIAMSVAHSPWVLVPLLSLVAAGTYASKAPVGALSSEWPGAAAAAGLAQNNAPGNLSRFVFNYPIGWIRAETGSYGLAVLPIALIAAIGTVCVLMPGRGQPRTVSIQH